MSLAREMKAIALKVREDKRLKIQQDFEAENVNLINLFKNEIKKLSEQDVCTTHFQIDTTTPNMFRNWFINNGFVVYKEHEVTSELHCFTITW